MNDATPKKKKGLGIVIGAGIGIVVLVLCLGGGGLVAKLVFGGGGGGAKPVLQRVPADAFGVILVSDLAGLHETYGLDTLLAEMDSEEREYFDEMFADGLEIEKSLMDDLLEVVDFASVGGISMAVVDDDAMVFAVIPVTDGEAAWDVLEDFADDNLREPDRQSHGDFDILVANRDEVAWAVDGKQVLLVASEARQAQDYLEDILDGKLGDAWSESWVTSIKSELGGPWHAMLLVNPDLPREIREELAEELDIRGAESWIGDIFDEIEGLGATLEVERGQWTAHGFMAVAKGTTWLEDATGDTKDQLAKHVGGDAVAVFRAAIDAEEWLEQTLDIPEGGDEMQQTLRTLKREMDVDFEDDVVPYLGSPVTVAVFDSESGRQPFSFVGWVPLNKGHEMEEVLEDIEDAAKDQGASMDTDKEGDITWYVVEDGGEEFAWAVVRKHLVFASGHSRIRDLQNELESPEGSFLDEVSNGAAKKVLTGSATTVAYVDLESLIDEFADDLESDRDTRDIWPLLEKMTAVFGELQVDGTMARASVTLVADDGDGFAEAIRGMLAGEEGGISQTRLRAMRSEAPTNLDAIRTAEKAYHAEWDAFTNCRATPANIPGKDAEPFRGPGLTNFQNLGWTADGNIRCRYSVTRARAGRSISDDSFEARAECDLDEDGVYSVYYATQSFKPKMLTPNNVY